MDPVEIDYRASDGLSNDMDDLPSVVFTRVEGDITEILSVEFDGPQPSISLSRIVAGEKQQIPFGLHLFDYVPLMREVGAYAASQPGGDSMSEIYMNAAAALESYLLAHVTKH